MTSSTRGSRTGRQSALRSSSRIWQSMRPSSPSSRRRSINEPVSPEKSYSSAAMKLSYLFKGLPGHPLHPPLTDATIGTYTAATAMGLASVIGVAEKPASQGWWLALVLGLIFTIPTAFSGFLDWLDIEWGTPLWKTATLHLTSMVTATVFFALAAIFGHAGYKHHDVTTGSYILTVVG